MEIEDERLAEPITRKMGVQIPPSGWIPEYPKFFRAKIDEELRSIMLHCNFYSKPGNIPVVRPMMNPVSFHNAGSSLRIVLPPVLDLGRTVQGNNGACRACPVDS